MSMYPLFTAERAEARTRQFRHDAENARTIALARAARPPGGTGIGDTIGSPRTAVEAPRTAYRHRERDVLALLLRVLVRAAGRFGIESGNRRGVVPRTSSARPR
jgi:hypothetical protein